MFMYYKWFLSIYVCDLSSYDYVWGIINYGMVLLRFCFFSTKKKQERERESVKKKTN